MRFLSFLILFFLHISCEPESTGITPKLEYAKGFYIENFDGYKKLRIYKPYRNSTKIYEYLLIPKKSRDTNRKYDIQTIFTPVDRIVLVSSSHIPLLELLNEESSLVGFPHTDFISSPKTRKLVTKKRVRELGSPENINIELLLDLEPELVMSFAVDKINKSFTNIQKSGIPVILNNDWLEETPLGRMEWIRLFGALYHKEKKADSIFNTIQVKYNKAKKIALKAKSKPAIMSGSIFKDIWYLPAGKSFIATYFKDAQTNYLWKDNKENGSLSLNFENVLEKGKNADFWIGCSLNTSKKQLLNENRHYKQFAPYKTDNIYTYANLKGEKGALLYFELGPTRPHIILKDIIKITHPELLPNHKLFFFEKIK